MVDLEKHKLCSWCGASIRVAVNSMGHHTPQECRTLMHEERTRLLAELTALRVKAAAGEALREAFVDARTHAWTQETYNGVVAALVNYDAVVKP